ncbi:MAG: hypothetical protein KA375_08510 [Vitreoscilla sp.]|nr:hypothetical protein [Vitreoscilla sp.]
MSVEKDRWLQQALRHAPDHDVAVPEALRDTILAAARAAVRQPQPVPPRHWWQGLMEPLAHPTRLGYSGAFMALLVVGLWGLDRLDQGAVVPEQAPVLSAPAATSASPATPTAPARPAQAVAVADQAALKEAAESRQMALAAKAKVGAQAERQRREDAPPTATATATATQAAAPVPAPTADLVAAAKPVPATATAPVAAPAPVSATAAAPSPAAVDAPLAAASPVAVTAPAGLTAPRLEAKLAAAIPRKAAVPSAARDSAAANAAAPESPLAAMLGGLRTADGARWQTTQAQGVHGFLQNQWLGRLQQLTQAGPWQPVAVLPEDPPTVQWLGRDGGQLWLQADGQLWLAWRGQALGARLPPAEALALRAQLTDWR